MDGAGLDEADKLARLQAMQEAGVISERRHILDRRATDFEAAA